MPPDPNDPLVQYLRVQRQADRDLNRVLERAARDAQRRIIALELGPPGIGARVRQAQLTSTLRAIREAQHALWEQGVGPLITDRLRDAQFAAIQAGMFMDDVLFEALPANQAEIMRASARAMAQTGLEAEAARISQELSPRVYRNADLASRVIEQTIRSGIIQGLSARELAATVARFIRPTTPGGISYAAMRLARTELNNAFHQRQIAIAQNKPWVEGVKWNLSGSHPKTDLCDVFAHDDAYGLGSGVFPPDDVPSKPHPHCLCFMTYEMQSPESFAADLARYIRTGR
jgi:hypothetical protein